MDNQEKISKDIQYHAQRCLYYNELLIEQCDNWLSAEEGNANMMQAIEERERQKRIARRRKFFGIDKVHSIIQKFKHSKVQKMSTNDDKRYQTYFGDEYANRYDSGMTAEEMSRKMVRDATRPHPASPSPQETGVAETRHAASLLKRIAQKLPLLWKGRGEWFLK